MIDIAFYEKRLNLALEAKDSAKINLYETYLFNYKKQYADLKIYIKESFPKYHKFKYKNKIVSLKDLQITLGKKNATLVQYFVGDKIAASLCISKNKIEGKYTHDLERIKDKIIKFKNHVSEQRFEDFSQLENYQSFCKNSQNLYQILLGNYMEPNLKKGKNLIIVPDGILGLIPFEALLSKNPNLLTINYQSLPYLIRSHSLSYAYSATLLVDDFTHKMATYNNEYLAFAPNYQDYSEKVEPNKVNLLNLPGALGEINYISSYFKGKVFLGREASKEIFLTQAGDKGIIHLAMHGTADNDNPNYSKLIFANNKDRYFYNYELNGLKLNAQLVVLSACETGFGKFYKGEGIMSLARNFTIAGASSVITSLWSIPDQSTSYLMENLYKNLYHGKAKGCALAQAKLAYLNNADNYSGHPYFWSGFVHFGKNEKIINPMLNTEKYTLIGTLVLFLATVVLLTSKINPAIGKKVRKKTKVELL